MLKITKKVEYALIALKFMGNRAGDELTSARELCDNFGMPFDTMAKVLQAMNQANWLSSVKGIKGGYTLTADLSKISFMELSRTIEGKDVDDVCMGHKGMCELHGTCNIVGPVSSLHRHVVAFLEQLTLDQLLSRDRALHVPAFEMEGKFDGI